jgi:hypothetical protein
MTEDPIHSKGTKAEEFFTEANEGNEEGFGLTSAQYR